MQGFQDLVVYLSILFGAILCCGGYLRLYHGKHHLPLPPGPRGLPVLGNVHQIPMQYQQNIFLNWAKRHGDIVYLRFFQKPAIIISSLKAAQDLMEKRGSKYSSRPYSVFMLEFVLPRPNLVLMPYTDQCRLHRKLFQVTFESRTMLDSYRPLQRRYVDILLADLVRDPEGFIAHLKRYAGALTIELAYGHHADIVNEEFMAFADKAMASVTEAGGVASTLVDFFPVMKYIPEWIPGGGFKRHAFMTQKMIREVMSTPYSIVRESMKNGNAQQCFTTFLLGELSEDGRVDDATAWDIKGAATVLYLGKGAQTMTTLISFILAMVLHRGTFEKAQAELDRVIGSERLPNLDDRESLPYLECVLKEVYRWNPPAPLGIPHSVTEEDAYRGYAIPADTIVIPNIWAMSRDVEQYSDPDTFLPERFEAMSPQEANKKDPRKYVFGFGRRICPGRFLADSSVWLAIANIVATMDIQKARDISGKEITPILSFKTGIVSHVDPFICDIKPRTTKTTDIATKLKNVTSG
ncbi:hypothetical protein IEO21_07775 [Rhodonia placenta]|uniref:Cytochrome P450 n=1 Tax=Rhodonia placenta TaxID=104341 RepID=A0A8H7NXF2_9APHY|nr:hypothetical protein IEO21_07775 [Postia placenta]